MLCCCCCCFLFFKFQFYVFTNSLHLPSMADFYGSLHYALCRVLSSHKSRLFFFDQKPWYFFKFHWSSIIFYAHSICICIWNCFLFIARRRFLCVFIINNFFNLFYTLLLLMQWWCLELFCRRDILIWFHVWITSSLVYWHLFISEIFVYFYYLFYENIQFLTGHSCRKRKWGKCLNWFYRIILVYAVSKLITLFLGQSWGVLHLWTIIL